MPLHCSCYDIIYLFCLVVSSGLTGLSTCHVNFLHYSFFWSLLPRIPTRPIHSVPWASLGQFILWVSLAQFIIPYLFHSHGLLLNHLGFSDPITASLTLDLLAFEPTPFTNSFLWASLANFYFLSISYNSHRPTTSLFGASSTRLLSLMPLIILVGWLTIIPVILAQ